jgi:GNAT superfamily N-acetyltransferase
VNIRTFTHDDFDAIFAAFADSFSDYVVKFTPNREQLLEMFTRRGWVPELSVGAYDGDRLVAFTINGLDGDRAYDSGTGVVLSHRRHGLGRALMARSFELLRDHAAEYVLEVIDVNEKAHALYLSCGFRDVRGLQCWTYDGPAERSLPDGATPQLDAFDVEPAWQNTTASIARARDPYVTIGDASGFAIVFPNTGDVPQLAVKRNARGLGIGTRLLQSAAAVAGKPLRIMNIDERAEGIAGFLERAGARRFVRQIEMTRPLR